MSRMPAFIVRDFSFDGGRIHDLGSAIVDRVEVRDIIKRAVKAARRNAKARWFSAEPDGSFYIHDKHTMMEVMPARGTVTEPFTPYDE